ncbi:hypothetical protein HMPREF9960_1330 [Streptococcus cristatus ATCC 51100]|uniref:Uncharacterized protein n=1 Tax=Streptococcus cristatus ATCC 51100 TaxID=889201 RepID=A0AAV3ED82_STRCR|nr:hypothetical protein HMPREF9960_1330 [Streptococcus cristatus ATCC 51100]
MSFSFERLEERKSRKEAPFFEKMPLSGIKNDILGQEAPSFISTCYTCFIKNIGEVL